MKSDFIKTVKEKKTVMLRILIYLLLHLNWSVIIIRAENEIKIGKYQVIFRKYFITHNQ